jgi:hypothetical protein
MQSGALMGKSARELRGRYHEVPRLPKVEHLAR